MAFGFGIFILRNITKLSPQTYVGIKGCCITHSNGFSKGLLYFSTSTSQPNTVLNPKDGKMCAWQIHSYGGTEELQLSCSIHEPVISKPDDVLVKVSAASVNPIDVAMMRGYGSTLLNKLRQAQCNTTEASIEFPLILGRDFSGQVVAVGHSVTNLKPGDEVWGVIAPSNQGCHAQRAVLSQSNIRLKPKNLTTEEASSILYAAVTAWSALRITGDLLVTGARGRRILVLGAAGGVGSIALQMAKAWGATVVGTCRTDAVPFVESLGADSVIDYALPDIADRLQSQGPFDIVLDAAGLGPDAGQYASCLKQWSNAKYITLKSPLLKNFDEHGLVLGALRSAADLVHPNLTSGALSRGATLRWGFFMPCNAALDEIQLLVEAGKISPCIQKVYSFKNLPQAYEHVLGGHLRGKVIISLNPEQDL